VKKKEGKTRMLKLKRSPRTPSRSVAASRKRLLAMKRIDQANQKLASRIEIDRLLSSGNFLEVNANGEVQVDYCNPAQRAWERIG
jgi:hypothetical protein